MDKKKNFIIAFFSNYLVVILSLIIVIFIFLIFYMNNIIIKINLMELKSYLTKINKEDKNYDFLGLLSKYKLYKDWYENKIDSDMINYQEIKINYLISSAYESESYDIGKNNLLFSSALFMINNIRRLYGAEKITSIISERINNYLAYAYYYERNKLFSDAIKLYNDALKFPDVTLEKMQIINLHQGFCYSIIGDTQKAKIMYNDVINNKHNENAVLTAKVLLKFLEGFEAEIKRVKESNLNPLNKSEKLIRLIAYKDALEILDTIDDGDIESTKVNYYKARCFEEIGEEEKSIQAYQEVILNDHKSDMAKEANKRLLVISSINFDRSDLKELAKKNNLVINDNNFNNLLKFAEKNAADNKLIEKSINKIDSENKQFSSSDQTEDKIISTYINESIAKVDQLIKKESLKPVTEKKEIKKEELIKKVIISKEDVKKKKKPYTVQYED
ncbi:MAG: hypothetical protein JXB50_02795, partial [Spirochaetes bacterium]|nr:hypothetical protein [Spirochaetota bacterium]